MYAPNQGQQGQQAHRSQGQAAQKTPSRPQSRPLPDLAADPSRANSTFSPSPLASQPIHPQTGVHAPIARPYQNSVIGHGIPHTNPTPHPLARSVSCAPSPAVMQNRNNVMRHHPYTQDGRPQTAHRASTPGPRTPGPRSIPVQHIDMSPTPLDPRLNYQPGLAHMHGQVMSQQYYPPVNALPPTPTSAGPAWCHPQQSWSWSVPNSQIDISTSSQTPVHAIHHQYQQPPPPSTPWLVHASLPSSAGSPYTNQAQLRAATPGLVEPKPSSAINVHLACETRYASLQAMCRSLDDAVNHISQAHARLQSESNPDMIDAMNQLIRENEELRSSVEAQAQTQYDPRLQQGANDSGDQQGTTNPTQKSLDALEKTNAELTMANTELRGQLLAESQISQSLRTTTEQAGELLSEEVVPSAPLATDLDHSQSAAPSTKLIAGVSSEVAGVDVDVDKLKLQTRVMELEAELKDCQMPWLKDGESGDKTRFEQLLSVYEAEKMEKEKIQHELQMANEAVTRQELIIGNRRNRREITKLQVRRLDVAQITDLTTTTTPDEDAMDIKEASASGSGSETSTMVESQTSQLIAHPSPMIIKGAHDRSLSNLKSDDRGLQAIAHLSPMMIKGAHDRRLSNLKSDDRGLQAIAHVGRICFGAMDLMEWIDGVLEQYCASRPLAERGNNVGRSKLKVLMSEIKTSVDCLLAPGPGSRVGRGEESQEGKAESSSSA